MSKKTDTFGETVRTKINEAGKRLTGLAADAKTKGQKAESDAKAYLGSLEDKVKAQRAQMQASRAKTK